MSHHNRIVFAGEITDGIRTRQFEVNEAGDEGWRVRERRDGAVVRQVIYDDWHRVELQVTGFVVELARLKNEGWRRTS